MAEQFADKDGLIVVERLIEAIQEGRAYLSEIDGAIGDGDHGVNMAKGFRLTADRLTNEMGLSQGLRMLGETLLTEIGGAMGPLYGAFFRSLANACKEREMVDARTFGQMLEAGCAAVIELGGAKVGDKTLVDTLAPASEAYRQALEEAASFADALQRMARAAERGKESTKNLVVRVGRSSRLGERSRGVLDAGAVSCYLILDSMAATIGSLLGDAA
jgi:dihydroxyacetone kinase-like protein